MLAEHCPQAPHGSQAGVDPPHSLSAPQARQEWVVVLQIGVEPPHCAFDVQGTHVLVAVKQTGVAPVQALAFVAEHWPHAPDDSQAGVAPPHSPSLAQARQACVAVLQTGVVAPHWAFDVQGTHVPVVVKQAGVAPVHLVVFVAEHCPHAPLDWQAGVVPPHSPSPPQPRQVWLPPSQMGVAPLQSALATHRTQVPAATLQTGVAPVHWVALPAEHCPQAPPGWQAGVAPAHSLSPEQARQTRRAGSQTGVAPPQSLLVRQPTQVLVDGLQTGAGAAQFASVTHCTQVALATLQTGVVPVHSVALVAEHWPQAPLVVQAGVLPAHSLSPPQARQACVPVSQVGAVPLQFAPVRQPTQTRGDAVVRQ